jgi:hypothetical protein
MTKLLSMRHRAANLASLLRSTLNDNRDECNVEIPMRGNSIVDAPLARVQNHLQVTDKSPPANAAGRFIPIADYDIARQEDQRKSSDVRSMGVDPFNSTPR